MLEKSIFYLLPLMLFVIPLSATLKSICVVGIAALVFITPTLRDELIRTLSMPWCIALLLFFFVCRVLVFFFFFFLFLSFRLFGVASRGSIERAQIEGAGFSPLAAASRSAETPQGSGRKSSGQSTTLAACERGFVFSSVFLFCSFSFSMFVVCVLVSSFLFFCAPAFCNNPPLTAFCSSSGKITFSFLTTTSQEAKQ